MTQHLKKLELTFKTSQGQIHKSSVTHFLDELDPLIFSEQLDRILLLDTDSHKLNSQRLCRSHCVKVDRLDIIRNKLFDTNQ